MSEPHPGLFGFIDEAKSIKDKLGVSITRAFKIQRRCAAERCKADEPGSRVANVIQFRPRGQLT